MQVRLHIFVCKSVGFRRPTLQLIDSEFDNAWAALLLNEAASGYGCSSICILEYVNKTTSIILQSPQRHARSQDEDGWQKETEMPVAVESNGETVAFIPRSVDSRLFSKSGANRALPRPSSHSSQCRSSQTGWLSRFCELHIRLSHALSLTSLSDTPTHLPPWNLSGSKPSQAHRHPARPTIRGIFGRWATP